MNSLRDLFNLADTLDDKYRSWMENHNIPLSIFRNQSPFRRPVYALLINGVILLVIAPGIICLIAGTIFKSNIAFVAMGIYAAIIIMTFFATLIYTVVTAIKNHRIQKKLIEEYLLKHPERKY